MMLKFRVWDKENSCFFKPVYEAYNQNIQELTIDLSGELAMRTYNNPPIHESLFPNRFVIQQYTGLNDKYGNEICIGDIVALTGETTEGFYRRDYYEVIINDFMQIPVIDSEIGQGKLYEVNNQCEVVGNIYQHNHLLVQS